MRRRLPIDEIKWWDRIRDHRYIRVVLYIITGVFLYFLLLGNVIPETIDIRLSQIAEKDIRSPLTVEDKNATEKRRREAMDAIGPIYEHKKEYAQNQVVKVNDIFDLVMQVKSTPSDEDDEEMTAEERLEKQLELVKSELSDGTSNQLSDKTLLTLLQAHESQLQIARETTTNAVFEVMSEQIRLSDVAKAKEDVKNKVAISTVNAQLTEAMIEIAQFAIIPNYIYDAEATERMRQEAAEAVEPVIITEGQLLVKEGDIVNHEVYEQLRLVGLLDDSFNAYPYIGLAILVILLVATFAHFVEDTPSTAQKNNNHLLMLLLIFFVTVILIKVSSFLLALDIRGIGYVVPISVGAMLITLLIDARLAIVTSFMFAIIGSIMFSDASTSGIFQFSYGIYMLFSSCAGAYFLSKSNRVTKILLAGLFVSFVNIVTVLALVFVRTVQTSWIDLAMYVGFAFLSGFIAAVITIGLLPFFEEPFGILTKTKLIELSNPNHPLLRKILTEAPGTYHHSVVVGNLAEAACETIGENGLLARVGAYYHDLGKTKRPHFFIENQMKMENPHNKISPQLSATIIIAHPYDGAEMLREYKMPKEIIDICEQHHGTTLLKYFYHKAQEQADQPVPESQFRYPGPKAQSKVAAIVGIADSVEAAVRSIQKPTPDKIESIVRKIIRDRLEDGQFDESDLTLRELDQIAVSICETLKGMFHQRIEYPEEEKGKGGNR